MANYKKGNVYEIKLDNGKYVYVCLMTEFGFGIFNYRSENQTDITNLLDCGFIKYKSCKRGGISKGVWKLIGNIDLEKHNIEYPDLACFMDYDPEGFTERSIVMRNLRYPRAIVLNLDFHKIDMIHKINLGNKIILKSQFRQKMRNFAKIIFNINT